MPRATIADAAVRLLTEHRVVPAEELGRQIAALGLTRARNPARAVTRALDADRRFRRLTDGRWVMPADLLRGITLTRRLSETELVAGCLALNPDLAPLATLDLHHLRLQDGRPLAVLWDDAARDTTGTGTDLALRGPAGWLVGAGPSRLLAVRVAGDRLEVGPGVPPRAASRLAFRRLAAVARDRLAEQEAVNFPLLPPAVSLDQLFLDWLAEAPSLARDSLPPLGEAFAAEGLEVHRGFVGLPGTDWEAVDDFMRFDDEDLDDEDLGDPRDQDDAAGSGERSEADLDDELAEMLNLRPPEVDGFKLVLGAMELHGRLGGFGPAVEARETNARLASILAWPAIARAVAMKAWIDPAVEAFVVGIEDAATGVEAAGPRFVLGACAEARADAASAERHFRSALAADPRHPFALEEVARYETDRGDFAAALAHLRAAGVPVGHSERAWLEGLVQRAVPKVGRNDPCPCGSGRKYKACHLDSPGVIGPVPEAKALLHKLDAWLSQPDMQRLGDEALARAAGRQLLEADPAQRPEGTDQLIVDVVLFERGGLRRFLEVRGGLLPVAERDLGQTWLPTRRSLYEVQATRPGGLTLRDLHGDGGVVEVADQSLSRQAAALDLLCMRLLPDGHGGLVPTDAILVPRSQRRQVLDLVASGDGLDLLRWVVTPPPPLRLQNMEGEPLRLITIEYRVADPGATAAILATRLQAQEDGHFVETFARNGEEWTRGSIRMEGDRATIDANSQKRATRLERTLLRAAPGARLIRREERGVEDALDSARRQGPGRAGRDLPGQGALDPATNPAVAAVLEEFIRKREVTWLDESIPALGGRTPRQAVADASARPELEALLDDMAWQARRAGPGGGLMDHNRVRALLGLPPRPV